MSKKVFATARVQVTLEIVLKDRWDDSASVEQIYRQAAESVKNAVTREGIRGRVIDEPKIIAILTEETG